MTHGASPCSRLTGAPTTPSTYYVNYIYAWAHK